MTDYTYYREEYGGMLSEEDFGKHRKAAEAVIAQLLLPRRMEDFPGREEAIRCAVCMQIDQAAENGGEGLVSEALGEYRVEYRAPEISVGGVKVSPYALFTLSGAGLLNQWI